MVDIPRMVRSKSQKLLGAIEAVLNLPVTLDRQLSGEAAREARSLVRARSYRRPEEEEYEAKFTGESIYQSISLASLLTDRLVLRQRDRHGRRVVSSVRGPGPPLSSLMVNCGHRVTS